jgi:oligoendopeptidase F
MEHSSINPHSWESLKPHYERLEGVRLDIAAVPAWLAEWSDLERNLDEARVAAYRARTEDTTDEGAERAYNNIVEKVVPEARIAGNRLKAKLLAVPGLEPTDETRVLLGRFRAEAAVFRDANAPIQAELDLLGSRYDEIAGAMSVTLDGEELTLQQAQVRLLDPDRNTRETAWKAIMGRWLQDRATLDDLYLRMLRLRRQMARNAGLPDFRELAWVQMNRFDYRPEDALRFHEAIEREVLPLVVRLMRDRQESLGVESLRPWDVEVDPENAPALQPFAEAGELEEGTARMLDRVDPELGKQFGLLRDGYLDLDSRKGKAPGGYCEYFPLRRRPYIFMNAAGTHDDVNTLLHEAGHAFHSFAAARDGSLVWNENSPMEFAEVASMSMELLASPYLERNEGGFYSPEDAARACHEHLEGTVRFLPYMAVVDAFQHWVYAEAPQDVTAAQLDAKWSELWERFTPGVDWSGFEAERATGWHRKLHIFQAPFYYVEYGLAQVGAWQVWRNSLADQAGALAAYQQALALGYTRSLPELFHTAGARLAFEEGVLAEAAGFLAGKLRLA